MRCVEPRTDARCGFLIYTGDVQRFHGLLDAADLVRVQVEILSHLGNRPVFQELADPERPAAGKMRGMSPGALKARCRPARIGRPVCAMFRHRVGNGHDRDGKNRIALQRNPKKFPGRSQIVYGISKSLRFLTQFDHKSCA